MADDTKYHCPDCGRGFYLEPQSNWHTGTPTEEGVYAVYYWDEHNPSATPYEALFNEFLSPDGEGNWIDRDGEIRFIDDDIVRWQKIEPYKEANG